MANRPWIGFGFMGGIFEAMKEAEAPQVNYTRPPATRKPAQKLTVYVRTYGNSYYGPLVVSAEEDELSMTLGPETRPTVFALTYFDGDTFSFETIGENANGLAGAIFTLGEEGVTSNVVLEFAQVWEPSCG